MSYDIELKDPVTMETIELDAPHDMRGGTYQVGGCSEAWLNVTYNYARWYYMDGVFGQKGDNNKGIRTIYGMTGAESIPVLKSAIAKLEACKEDMSYEEIKDYVDHGCSGYWLPTRENAIKPLYQLLALAQMRPDGIWDGD